MASRRKPPTTSVAQHSITGTKAAGKQPNKVITAAASVYKSSRVSRAPRFQGKNLQRDWQGEAWDLYDEVGELRFSVNWNANAASLCRLVGAVVPRTADGEPEPVDEGEPAEVMEQLGSRVEQSSLIKRGVQHLSVPGETYIVARQDSEDDLPEWGAFSSEEVRYTSTGERWTLDDGSGAIDLDDNAVIIRAWQPHPRRYQWADSQVRGVLPVARELRGLTMHVSAQIDSRLSTAGLLLVPNSVQFPSPPGADLKEGEDPLMWTFVQTAMTAIRDRDSAAALVPIILRVPDDLVDKIKFIRFDSPLDDKAKELRDEAIRRLALGLDMPPEILLGLGETSNHWSAWQIDESRVRMSVAPLLTVLCHALTIGWYRPALEDLGVTNPEDYMVWFDTSPLEIRGDRSAAAVTVYDRAELSGEALRRENGFSDEDAPTPKERRRIVLLNAALKNPAAALEILAELEEIGDDGQLDDTADEDTPDPDADDTADGEDTSGEENRDLPEEPTNEPGEEITAAAALPAGDDPLLYACHVAVCRALDIAGKRMFEHGSDPVLLAKRRQFRERAKQIPTHLRHTKLPIDKGDIDRLLRGAWESIEVAFPEHAPCLSAALDRYTRALIEAGEPHQLDYLRAALDREHCYA